VAMCAGTLFRTGGAIGVISTRTVRRETAEPAFTLRMARKAYEDDV